jgi:hypothetical protein
MSMRAKTVMAICVGLMLVAVPAGASGSVRKPPPSCPPRHTHTLVADRQAVVYKGPGRGEGGPQPEDPEFYGCVRQHGKSYVLGIPETGSQSGSLGTNKYTLSGAVVAFEESRTTQSFEQGGNTEIGYYRSETAIIVRDLRSGRVLHRLATGTDNSPKERKRRDVGIGYATALVVKSNGAVAWIVNVVTEATFASGVTEYQVHAVDSTGSHVLAAGPSIEPKSLTLTGSALHWTQGGKQLSATLR